MLSRDHMRARRAYEAIGDASPKGRNLAIRLPMMLRTNGLLATWSFGLAKRDKQDEYRELLGFLLDHLQAELGSKLLKADDTKEAFRGWLASNDADVSLQLRQMTAEALAYSAWLKRAAEAYGAEDAG